MISKNLWRIVTFTMVGLLTLTNLGYAKATKQIDTWPDSLIGEWKGDIIWWYPSGNNDNNRYTNEMEIKIEKDSSDGHLLLTYLGFFSGPSSSEENTQTNQDTVCFNNMRHPTLSYSCITLINDNEISYNHTIGSEQTSYGTLHRVDKTMGAGCESADRQPQYGIINIGPDVFVILCGQRWLVPNPTTLDALGISRDMINNMGLDDTGLSAIPRSTLDIPDVDRDPNGFQLFMSAHGQEIEKIKGGTSIQNPQVAATASQPQSTPLVEVPIGSSNKPDTNWYCATFGIFCDTLAAEISQFPKSPRHPFDDGQPGFQCTEYVQIVRPDALCWLEQPANANQWAKQLSADESKYLGITHDDNPRVGDIIVWENNCSTIDNHVGLVVGDTNNRCNSNQVAVTDANHNNDGKIYDGDKYTCYAVNTTCMEFIHQSTKILDVNTCTATSVYAKSACDQYSGFRKWWCKITGK